MMTDRDILNKIIGEELGTCEMYSKVCEVISVDEDTRSCEVAPVDGTANVTNVRLQASLSQSVGMVSIPKVGSKVMVTFFNQSKGFVSLATEVDKVLLDCEEVTMNGGDNGGMVNIKTLVTELNKNNAMLNALLAVIGGAPIPEPGLGAASVFQAALNAATAALSLGSFDSIEDTKIKH